MPLTKLDSTGCGGGFNPCTGEMEGSLVHKATEKACQGLTTHSVDFRFLFQAEQLKIGVISDPGILRQTTLPNSILADARALRFWASVCAPQPRVDILVH